jgi:3alpha(or 20beta)-hydroxysteroid dehydrogenase
MAGRVEGKVALVTGAAQGMGRAVATMLAGEGATVIATDVRDPAGDLPSSVTFRRLDVTDEHDWKRVIEAVREEHGRLDVLVNNAGIIAYESVSELSVDDWRRVIDVNQTGVFLGMREAIPVMRANGKGSIVNFSSIWGCAAVAGAHAYHATKGAVRNMTKNAAMTHATDGIRVNSVHPGFIDTPLTAAQDAAINDVVISATPMKRAGKPDEVAYGCLFLASDESAYMTGAELVIDGGYLAQ